MLNNPFAGVFRQAFIKDVLNDAVQTPVQIKQHPERVRLFMDSLNHFLKSAGQPPILYQKYAFNEHKLFEYALFLRGYMRDSQKILASLEQKYATDEHLIDLFQASSEYIVACNHQLHDKRVFDNNVAYHFWKIDLQDGLPNAHYLPQQPAPEKHNLFLFMPFRVTDDEKTLNKWLYANMRDTLNNQEVFVKNVDTFVVFYPIQKSRASNITSLLKTIRDGNTYFEKQDMAYVQKNWLHFIAQDIQTNDNGDVISAKPYSKEQLFSNLRRMTVFSYCAGTANAHRCLNALYKV
ncbi:MAG: hypothetical protein J6Y91_06555, partial [Alphaproteobacteria bacterium]|nr:hypothetical protein [Alphaproteobacteria bacterium]